MADRTALTATGSSGARQCQQDRRRERQQSNVPAAPDRLAPTRSARLPAVRRRPRPDGENFGGEVSSCCFPEMLNASRIYSPLMFAALMIGHHFSISAL